MKGKNRTFNRLSVSALNGEPAFLGTIATARIVNFSGDYLGGGEGKDRKLVLTFKETGDQEYVVNATSYRLLTDRYGDGRANDFKAWLGQDCVLVPVDTTNPQDGSDILALWVARPKDWDTAVRALRGAAKRAR